MTRPIPHDYQTTAIEATRDHLRAGRPSVLIVAPTGAGKTTIAAEIIHAAMARGSDVLFLAHRSELITQASKRLDLYGIDHGIIMPGTKRAKPRAQVQVASVQTLARRDEVPPADLVIVDEAHRAKAASYRRILEAYGANTRVLGLTATPWRLDGSGLGDLFAEMVVVCQPRYLIERTPAVLVSPRVFAPVTPDLGGVKVDKGDFEQAAIQKLMATVASVDEIIRNWRRYADGRLTVAFAAGVAHSLMIRDAFRAAGVAAEHIDGTTHPMERERILADLAAGRVQVVCNADVLCEGWDCPQVSCAVLARPTQSLSLYLQQVGRVLRAAPGKDDAIVLDHAGNWSRFGMPTDDREWDLAGRKKREKNAAPVKTCPECFACVPAGCTVCPECQTPFVAESGGGGGKKEADRDLVEVTHMARPKLEPITARGDRWLLAYRPEGREATMEEKQRLYDELARRCIEGNRKTGWIFHKFKLALGQQPAGQLRKRSPYGEEIGRRKDAERAALWGEVSA
jgi:superfamily II DNA or RNA helicase